MGLITQGLTGFGVCEIGAEDLSKEINAGKGKEDMASKETISRTLINSSLDANL